MPPNEPADAPTILTPTRPMAAQGRLDSVSMRARNRGMLLRDIWGARATSRADLARKTGLSRSAVSALVESLLDSGLVEETGPGISRGGRKPTLLNFVDDAFSIIGVDLGAAHVTVVATNLRGEIKAEQHEDHATRDDPAGALALVRRLVAAVRTESGIAPGHLLGVGLAIASPVNPNDLGRLPPLFMPAWRETDLMTDLALPDDPPLFIDNDANLGALAESWWGEGRDGADLAFIKLGTGIGAGFVINGHIFRGHGGTAGEIGHLVIDPQGPQCVCGLSGCLTTFIGTGALLAAAERGRQALPGSLLPTGTLDVHALVRAVAEGDALARRVVSEAAQRLGLAVAGLLNLMNPKTVVLGGELATVGDALLHPLRECVQQRSMWSAVANSRIVTSKLGECDVALGAATRVLQAALDTPSRFPVGWSA